MNEIFEGCSSLLSLPDISKWNTNNLNKKSCLFNKCSSLTYLPNILRWKSLEIKDIKYVIGTFLWSVFKTNYPTDEEKEEKKKISKSC